MNAEDGTNKVSSYDFDPRVDVQYLHKERVQVFQRIDIDKIHETIMNGHMPKVEAPPLN